MPRPSPLVLWLCAGAVLAACSASAQYVRWSVEAGFENTCRQGAWVPIAIDLANTGSSVSARVAIPVKSEASGPRAGNVAHYILPVDLPQNSIKRHFMYVPARSIEEATLATSAGQREKKDLRGLDTIGLSDLLLVVVGGDRGLLKFLSGTPMGELGVLRQPGESALASWLAPSAYGGGPVQTDAEVHVTQTQWSRLPDSWIGWDAVDAVVLGDGAANQANTQGTEALVQWLRTGGTIIVPGGALGPALATSPLRDYLPLRVTGTASVPDLESLAEWAGEPMPPSPTLVCRGPLREGATLLCGSYEEPLAVLMPVGGGQVVMTTFDYTARPIKSWDGQPRMWGRLLAAVEEDKAWQSSLFGTQSPGYRYHESPDAQAVRVASYVPEARLPSIWLMVGFLVAYIIALVPINYLVLRKLDRRELGWVTTPFIVLVFTIGAYATGYSMRGGQIILNRFSVIEVGRDAELARARVYLGLFSPARRRYEIELGKSAVAARDPSTEGARPGVSMVSGSTRKISNIAMNMWTTRAFSAEYLADVGGAIEGVAEYDGKQFSAQITNSTRLRLDDCVLMAGAGSSTKTNFAPGQSVAITCSASRGTRPYATPPRYGRPQNAKSLSQVAGEQLLSYNYGSVNVAPCLVAFSDEPLAPATVAGAKTRTVDCNLLVAPIPVQLKPNARMSVPQFMIRHRITRLQGDVQVTRGDVWGGPGMAAGPPGATGILTDDLRLARGSATFEFSIPKAPGGVKASALGLTHAYGVESTTGTVKPLPEGVRLGQWLWLYNFTLEEWDQPHLGVISSVSSSIRSGGAVTSMGGPGMGGPGMGGPAPPGMGGPGLASSEARFSLPAPWDYMSNDGRVLARFDGSGDEMIFGRMKLTTEVKTF